MFGKRLKKMRLSDSRGFTMIELIMVIVILGILAAIAVPKFQDFRSEASEAMANRVFAAAHGAATVNFSKGLLGKAGYTPITDGAELMGALDDQPKGWVSGTTDTSQICYDTNLDGDCTGADPYIITVTSAETMTPPQAQAVLGTSW